MHVLILPTWYPPKPHGPGGVVFRNYAKMFQEVGCTARICYIDYGLNLETSITVPLIKTVEEEVEVIRFRGLAFPKRNPLLNRYWLSVGQKAIEKYISLYGKPDIIHAHSYFSLFLAHRLNLTLKVPYVYTEHSTAVLLNNISTWKWKRIRRAIQNSRLNTAVSDDLARVIHKNTGILPMVLPNPVNTNLFKPGNQLASEGSFVLSCGSKVNHKGLDVLLHALSISKKDLSVEIKLYLTDQPKEFKFIKKYIVKYKLEESVKLIGFIPQKELSILMQNCVFYISSSRFETFGMPIFEALSCGKPVVSTKTSGVKSFIPESNGLWSEPGSVESLVNNIIEMSQTYSKYLVENQREVVYPSMSFEKLGVKYISILERLL